MRRFVPHLVAAVAGITPLYAYAELRPIAAQSGATTSIAFDSSELRYSLVAQSDYTVAYSLDLDDPQVASGMLRVEASVDGGPAVTVISHAGTRYRTSGGAVLDPEAVAAIAAAQLVEHHVQGDDVVLVFREQPGGHPLEKTFHLSLAGSALRISMSSAATFGADGYAGVSLGHAEGIAGARVLRLPFLPEPIALLPDGNVLSAIVDPTLSSSVRVDRWLGVANTGEVFAHARTTSEPDTAGVAAPLSETCFVTLAPNLPAAYPAVVDTPSPYRSELSRRLVMDVWNLHRSFSVPEGVTLEWESPENGDAQVSLRYADLNGACGDGVLIVVRHNDVAIERIPVPNGQTAEQLWQHDVSLQPGDEIRVELLRNGDNGCDSTRLGLVIGAPSDTYDAETDFSSTQGQRGFSYLETVDGVDTPMTFDTASATWTGAGAYSMIGPGAAHPGQGNTAFRDARNMVRRYREYGMTDLAIIFHVWQRWGYDEGLPDHHPANPAFGSGPEMAAFVEEAKQAGMLLSLHENYTDMYPDNPPDYPNPLWDPSAIALDMNGNPVLGWYQEATGQQAFRIAARSMRSFADSESAAIAADYAPNASYLDVGPGWSPALGLDHDATKNAIPTLADCYAASVELFAAMKAAYQGPLFGEGGEGPERFDTYFAGAVDGVERQIESRRRAIVAPDYELSVVRPRMLNHGMGYYSRYFVEQAQANVSLQDVDLDQYRASEIAFGHAGFLGDSVSGVPNWMQVHAPEYWLLQALQSRYADAVLQTVAYESNGQTMGLEEALRANLDLSGAHLRVDYESGLSVWINRDSPQRSAGSVSDFSHEQGHRGWRYVERNGASTSLLSWYPAAQVWRGGAPYLIVGQHLVHPDGAAAERVFTVPDGGTMQIRGSVEDADTSCGDGVVASVLHEDIVIWQCALPEDPGAPCSNFDLARQVAAQDSIALRVEQKANNSCDSTLFGAELTWSDAADHDWTVTTAEGNVVLPPSGFFAQDASGFRAATRRLPSGEVVDWVSGNEYSFARSRNGSPQSIGDMVTDGAIAVVPGVHGDDLHAVGLLTASRSAGSLLSVSTRCDANLRFVDDHAALITVRALESGPSVDVTWGALPGAWRAVLESSPDAVQLFAADEGGNPVGAPTSLATNADGDLVLSALAPDQHYRIVLSPDCGDGGCGVDGGADGGTDGEVNVDGGDAGSDGDAGGSGSGAGGSSGGSASDEGCGCRTACEAPGTALWWMLVVVLTVSRRMARGV